MAGLLDEEELLPVFSNPNIARQGDRARALAARRNVNTLPDPRTYAAVQGLLGTRPDEMGFSVLNPAYDDIRRVADPAFAVGTALGVAPLMGMARFSRPVQQASAASQRGAVRATKGLPVGASIKNVGSEDYLQSLRPVDVFGNGRRIDYYDDAKGIMYSATEYPKGTHWTAYDVLPKFEGGNQVIGEMDRHRSFADVVAGVRGARISESAKARNAKYAVIPNTWSGEAKKIGKSLIDAGVEIDRVTSSTQSKSKYIYLENGKKIRISDHELPNAYDAPEFDFRYGGDIKSLVKQIKDDQVAQTFEYPQEEALRLAQQRAALPVEQGGLGLPKDNTPMDRARAMGYTTEGYRGSTVAETTHQNPLWWSEDPQYASAYAAHSIRPPKGQPDPYAGNVMPVLVNIGKSKEFEKFNVGGVPTDPFSGFKEGVETGFRRYAKNEVTGDMGGKIWEALTLPQNVRSRFAAFDPFRRTAAIAATMGVAAPDLLARTIDDEERRRQLLPGLLTP